MCQNGRRKGKKLDLKEKRKDIFLAKLQTVYFNTGDKGVGVLI
jgi:hypothetical protein